MKRRKNIKKIFFLIFFFMFFFCFFFAEMGELYKNFFFFFQIFFFFFLLILRWVITHMRFVKSPEFWVITHKSRNL